MKALSNRFLVNAFDMIGKISGTIKLFITVRALDGIDAGRIDLKIEKLGFLLKNPSKLTFSLPSVRSNMYFQLIQPVKLFGATRVIPEWAFVGSSLVLQHVPLQFITAIINTHKSIKVASCFINPEKR